MVNTSAKGLQGDGKALVINIVIELHNSGRGKKALVFFADDRDEARVVMQSHITPIAPPEDSIYAAIIQASNECEFVKALWKDYSKPEANQQLGKRSSKRQKKGQAEHEVLTVQSNGVLEQRLDKANRLLREAKAQLKASEQKEEEEQIAKAARDRQWREDRRRRENKRKAQAAADYDRGARKQADGRQAHALSSTPPSSSSTSSGAIIAPCPSLPAASHFIPHAHPRPPLMQGPSSMHMHGQPDTQMGQMQSATAMSLPAYQHHIVMMQRQAFRQQSLIATQSAQLQLAQIQQAEDAFFPLPGHPGFRH